MMLCNHRKKKEKRVLTLLLGWLADDSNDDFPPTMTSTTLNIPIVRLIYGTRWSGVHQKVGENQGMFNIILHGRGRSGYYSSYRWSIKLLLWSIQGICKRPTYRFEDTIVWERWHFWRSEININYRLIECIRGFCSSPLPILKLSLQAPWIDSSICICSCKQQKKGFGEGQSW